MEVNPKVIYMDEDLCVVDKPPGLLSIPDGHDHQKYHLRTLLEPRLGRLWIVHRLDKDTSGLILLARNKKAHRHLNEQFANHQVEKFYRAIIIGIPSWDEIVVDKPLLSNVGRRKRTIVDDQRGKPARTIFRLISRLNDFTLVDAQPFTGRRHQIRVHLYYLGYPILADPLYGEFNVSPHINRLALHSRGISFIHPRLGKCISFTAPEPHDFVNALRAIT